MANAFQIVCVALIAAAVVWYVIKNRPETGRATRGQVLLAAFQVALCGGFFALSLSDALDLRSNFNAVRVAMDFFYDLAFLSVAAYTLLFARRESDAYLKAAVWVCAVLIAAQCFLFPYETENEWKRIFEAAEGAAVFALLVLLTGRLRDARFGSACLLWVTAMELSVAVINVARPAPGIPGDFQAVDVPMNYASLFMRPVLFGSLALAYRVWLDRRGLLTDGAEAPSDGPEGPEPDANGAASGAPEGAEAEATAAGAGEAGKTGDAPAEEQEKE